MVECPRATGRVGDRGVPRSRLTVLPRGAPSSPDWTGVHTVGPSGCPANRVEKKTPSSRARTATRILRHWRSFHETEDGRGTKRSVMDMVSSSYPAQPPGAACIHAPRPRNVLRTDVVAGLGRTALTTLASTMYLARSEPAGVFVG